MEVRPFLAADADEVAAICAALGWATYADPTVAERGFLAPGVVTRVAVDDGVVLGFAQACGDGVMASYLSQLGVVETHRRRGIARRLVEAVFADTGAARMDLLTDDAPEFYSSFVHRATVGFRIYPARA